MQRVALSLTMVCGFGLAACDQERAESPTPLTLSRTEPTLRPVASVKQIMQGITIPASSTVFAVAGTAPADDAGWQAVEVSAMAVAESGNLLLMKPRAVDGAQWRQFSLALVAAGERAAKAAQARDVEQTSLAGDDMYDVCEQCHARYAPQSIPPPARETVD